MYSIDPMALRLSPEAVNHAIPGFECPNNGVRVVFRRTATITGSRGFQPTDDGVPRFARRAATIERNPHDFNRRSATRAVWLEHDRGLKPTAIIKGSLRDQDCIMRLGLNLEASAPAMKNHENFEDLGI